MNKKIIILKFITIAAIILMTGCNTNGGSSFKADSSDKKRLQTWDETDRQLFERVSNLFGVFKEKSDEIWQESYRLDKMPIIFVRTDGKKDLYAFILNHPDGDRIKGATEYILPDELNLSTVYKLTDIPDKDEIAKIANFSFDHMLEGTPMYLMKYTKAETDEFAAPVSHDWTIYLAHEGLHVHQLNQWQEIPGSNQDIAGYPITKEHLALIMLEDAALADAVKDKKESKVKEFIAIRKTRIKTWNEVRHLDLPQEHMEGTARYIEHRLGSLLNYGITNLNTFYDQLEQVPEKNIRDIVAFGRFYATGAALCHLLDQMNINWKDEVEKGYPQFNILGDHYNLSDAEISDLLSKAKKNYNFDNLLLKAEKAANIAAREPIAIFN